MQLSAEHEQFRQTVRSFVDKEINPHIEEWERAGLMPLRDLFTKAAKLGLLGLEYDSAYGGQGGDDPAFTMILSEELGRAHHGSFPMAFGVQAQMATPSLHQYGTAELKQTYLLPAMEGTAVAAVAVTEPDAGSDVAALRTRAVRDGDDWVISGSKMYITNSLQADWICVLARTSTEGGYKGMSQIIVPAPTTGLTIRKLDKLGMRASDTGLLTFDGVRVPVSNTVGEIGRGFQQQMTQFVIERMWAVYGTVGSAQLMIERTKEYAQQRTVFGGSLMSKQYLQFELAELAADVDMLRVYNLACVEKLRLGQDITREATIGKLKCGRLARAVADWAIQIHGGIGYMEETWTARAVRDTRLASIGGGADEVMLQVLARIDGFQ